MVVVLMAAMVIINCSDNAIKLNFAFQSRQLCKLSFSFCSKQRNMFAVNVVGNNDAVDGNQQISWGAWMCSFAFLAVFMLPLIVVEFYFGLHSISCQHDSYFMTLTTWLLVDASFQLFILVVLGAIISRPYKDILMLFLKPFQICCVITWTVVGAVLFLKHLLPSTSCADNILIFMWIRIIGGFISISKLVL